MGINLFISYSHKDEQYKDNLQEHLSGLKFQGIINAWDDRAILAGEKWDDEIMQNMRNADIILFLVSPSFMASGYINDVEIKYAMERHEKGEVIIVPVIIRPCDLSSLTISKFQAVPKNAKPIVEWDNMDNGYLDVVLQLKRLINKIGKVKNNNSSKIEKTTESIEHTSEITEYITANIRKMINAAFNDETLQIFCMDYFTGVYDNLANQQSKNQKINSLLDYTKSKLITDKLIELLEQENKAQFDKYKPYY